LLALTNKAPNAAATTAADRPARVETCRCRGELHATIEPAKHDSSNTETCRWSCWPGLRVHGGRAACVPPSVVHHWAGCRWVGVTAIVDGGRGLQIQLHAWFGSLFLLPWKSRNFEAPDLTYTCLVPIYTLLHLHIWSFSTSATRAGTR
jgi:hypothetical protein